MFFVPRILYFAFGSLIIFGVACSQDNRKASSGLTDKPEDSPLILRYPHAMKGTEKDDFFGEVVEDPYRWLENSDSEATQRWIKAQNSLTQSYLSKIPSKEEVQERLSEIWNYEKYTIPFQAGDFLYFFKNDGLQNQSVLYREKRNGEEELFFDPNSLSEDGTVALMQQEFSKSGRYMAYSVSEGGSDWRKIYVLDSATKTLVGEPIDNVKFSGIAWKNDDGFFYSSYDKPKQGALSKKNNNHKIYYHRLGDAQSSDTLVFGGEPDEIRRYAWADVSDDSRFLVVYGAQSTSGNDLRVKNLESQDAPWIHLLSDMEADGHLVASSKDILYIQTNLNAPNQKLVAVNINKPQRLFWRDVIPESRNVLSTSSGAGFLFAEYLKDARSQIFQYDFNGKKIREIQLPGLGSVRGFDGKTKQQKLYYSFTNYVTPSTILSFTPSTGQSEIYRASAANFSSDNYVSKTVFYRSKDGTKIPLTINHKRGLTLSGKNPTILYGYGGFNVNIVPRFNIAKSVWMERGGIYAVANLRGGGEYGKDWHLAGTQLRKQNVFDDFIAAAEFLHINHYTSPEHLAIEGRSNGGLLVGAVMTQRPDLAAVALPAVGVLDMLRYHKFTAGAGWAYDYGTADQSEAMFRYLLAYSPVHQVKPGSRYPATLITTADHDDRVVPAHSYKFAAALQDAQGADAPVLIRIDTKAGHGSGTPVTKRIELAADILSFTWFHTAEEQAQAPIIAPAVAPLE